MCAPCRAPTCHPLVVATLGTERVAPLLGEAASFSLDELHCLLGWRKPAADAVESESLEVSSFAAGVEAGTGSPWCGGAGGSANGGCRPLRRGCGLPWSAGAVPGNGLQGVAAGQLTTLTEEGAISASFNLRGKGLNKHVSFHYRAQAHVF